ncbi:MAG TPA: CBS domain-containing protein [Gammaproteobacteria bacterium]|nr:CBS domain-containing protein [Gammaproteobacteria bacterium]
MSEESGKAGSWLERLRRLFSEASEPADREELVSFLREAQARGLFDEDVQSMLEGVLSIADMRVRDIMIPRGKMVVVRREDSPEQIIATAIESGHSRFPVLEGDEINYVLLAKDMLRYCTAERRSAFSMRDILRKAKVIPESKRLNVLLREFRAMRNHIAIVVDEYGGVSGMVTIEDVLEQIVGEIEDEHDIDEDKFIQETSKLVYTVKATTPIEDFNEVFETDFGDEDFDTVGGLVIHHLGHLPRRGETIVIGKLSFQVTNADNRRIKLLTVTRLVNEDAVQPGATAD